MNKTYTNPIIPGYYPDPSICRVGDDYYIVNSTFELFPALPIFHSRDLVNWNQIGHVVSEPEYLYINANIFSGGMMAPTIRYHNGKYYVIAANFADKGNFISTATDPAGPWSKPLYLPDVPGIDASLFFDDDGTCYVCSTGTFDFPDGKEQGIWGAAFDPEQGVLLSEKKLLWHSAMRGGTNPEAPHIYHIGDWYYLMTAEGGTEFYHSVAISRCKDPLGSYTGCPSNPVLTHRHLGQQYPIGNPGHADLVETQKGKWYAVFLASRLVDGLHKNMGRETYMVPVEWEDGWPVFSPGTGRCEFVYPAPDTGFVTEKVQEEARDHFDSDQLGLQWVFWGTPYQDFWKIEDSCLKLRTLPRSISRPMTKIDLMKLPEHYYDDNVACVLRRQRQPVFEAVCHMSFNPGGNESAGMVLLQQSNHQLRLEKCKGKIQAVLVECPMNTLPFLPDFQDNTSETVIAVKDYQDSDVTFKMDINNQDIQLYINDEFFCSADGRRINPKEVGPMTGTMIGMFASGNGNDENHWADFDWFSYTESNN